MEGTLTAGKASKESRPKRDPKGKTTASEVLRHPIRVRILEALNTHDILSPVEFLHKGFARGVPGLQGRTLDAQMSNLSYHFRVLVEMDCIVLVATRPVRGSEEHFYRARSRAYFTDEEWSALGREERAAISKTMLQGFMAQAEGALLCDTFDSRLDRWLAWVPFKVDKRGWAEMVSAIACCYTEVEQIRHAACARLGQQADLEAIPVTFGIFGFESPMVGDAPLAGIPGASAERMRAD